MKDFHKFMKGFHNFREDRFAEESVFFEKLQEGQNPKTLVIGCCDSRVDPAMLMGCKPGDIFVVRNVAALVPPITLEIGQAAVMSAVEYAIKHLKIENIIVLGHSSCGGIHALLHPELIAGEKYIQQWVSIATPTLFKLRNEIASKPREIRYRYCEEAAVLMSVENLLSYPTIAKLVDEEKLALHAWYFDMGQAELFAYDPVTEQFVPLHHMTAEMASMV